MPAKIHGLIIVDESKQPIVDSYGNVAIFKNKEDAAPFIPTGGKLLRVVTALVPRKRKKESK